ncbi:putative F-box protein [Zostera marina]|uniref:Putative F-box protein n=1 Tax=Zostera marina TaxID=29655 RepID=A0A0K9P253_ZOSMR|nr:putative F-box protein [Zostera marina]
MAMAEKLKITKLKTGKDRISSLPEQAINKILGSLPIRDAISTSFSSKGWRYKWRLMSDLIFHSDSFSRSGR